MGQITLGQRISQLRLQQELSIEQVAERAQINPELMQKLESDEHIPSLSPLVKIARALGVRLGTLLEDKESEGPIISRSSDSLPVLRFSEKDQSAQSDLDFYSLANQKKDRHMEPFVIDIHPSSARDIHLSTHEGEEFIYVLKGSVEIYYGKEVYTLHEGDSVYYDSIVSHNVHCLGKESSRILAVVYTPL